jgi:hypothetical protein
VPEGAFYMKGSIDQVVEEARGAKRSDTGAKPDARSGDERGDAGEDEAAVEDEAGSDDEVAGDDQ